MTVKLVSGVKHPKGGHSGSIPVHRPLDFWYSEENNGQSG